LFECLAAEDWDAAAEHYAVDATHTNPAWGEPVVGREAIRADEEQTGSLYSTFRYTIVNIASTDSVVLTERTGTMTMAGKDITMHMATVHEVNREGKISASRAYV